MKIAQVCPYNIYRAGGVQSHIYGLAKELDKRGHHVSIISPKVDSKKDNQNDVFPHYHFGSCTEVSINKTQLEISIAGAKEIEKIKDFFNKESFDIVHFHEPWVPLLSIQLLEHTGGVNIGTFHSASPDTLFTKSLETFLKPIAKVIVNSLDEVITVSRVPAKYIKQIYKKEISIIPNGLDTKQFEMNLRPIKKYQDDKITIFFIGRMDKRKGVIYLVKAFRKLKKRFSNVRLVIGGKGDEFKKVQRYIKAHEIEDIDLVGFVEEKDKARYFASCDIFCSPALYGESFGIVLVEAMVSGKPIIAGMNPGYKSVLEGRGELCMVNPKKTERFAEILEILCRDKELRDFLGSWGKDQIKKYSWDTVCDQVLLVYERSLEKKPDRTKKKPNTQRIADFTDKFLRE
jgi:phosphatidylinositol alpha-mannosyltransferase